MNPNKNCPSEGVEPTKPKDDADYKKQAFIFHPDKNVDCKDDATKKFQELQKLNGEEQKAIGEEQKAIGKGDKVIGEEQKANGEGEKAIGEEQKSNTSTDDNVRYAIIQIDNGKITVLDTSNEPFVSGKPRELLETKSSSIFAIKITKKDCTETAGIKCIEYGGAKYELDLETVVKKEDAESKLIDEKFLGSAVPASGSVTNGSGSVAVANGSGSDSKVSDSDSNVTGSGSKVSKSNASTSKPADEYTVENVEDFFKNNTNASAFSNFLENNDKNNFKENMNYLKIAESVVRNQIQQYDVQKCQNLMGEAAMYAWSIIESQVNIDNDKQFSEILTAFEILHVIDPSNADLKSEKKEKIDEINKKINEKINGNKITDITSILIESKAPEYKNIPKLTGYTPVIVDKGGSGNCFYYSVWGGLKDLGQPKYDEIVTSLTAFAKTLKKNSDVDFVGTINDKEKFNTNIRKLLAHCFLAETNNTTYTNYLQAWNSSNSNDNMKGTDNGVGTVSMMAESLAYGLRTIIQAKCKEYESNNNAEFFKKDEFKNILANNVITDGVFATQIEVDMIKKVFSNCNVIIDIYSPGASIDYNKDKLPTEFGGFSYIYVRHTGGEHYQQIRTTTGEAKDSTFTRDKVDGDSPFWKYIVPTKGGSRKTLGPKSKKTRRKYYVYKK